LNQKYGIKNSHKWLNFLPKNESDTSLFWERVYKDIIILAEILVLNEIDSI
jgi:hypothetical protein